MAQHLFILVRIISNDAGLEFQLIFLNLPSNLLKTHHNRPRHLFAQLQNPQPIWRNLR